MEIRKIQTLRGPNIWASFTVLEILVDLGTYKDVASCEMPGFNERLKSWLPTLVEHRCSVGERGGFFSRLERGTYLAHVLEHVALELQTLAGTAVGFGKSRLTSEPGVYRVAVEYEDETLGRASVEAACELLMGAAALPCTQGGHGGVLPPAIHEGPERVLPEPATTYDVSATIQRLRDIAHENRLGPSTRSIVRAARRRRIPFRRLSAGSLVQFGYGAKQRRILAAETDRTSAIALDIAQDKELTKELLRACGLPVPWGRPVSDAEDAWAAAESIGVPVVVKPRYGNQGRGVATNLTTREQVLAAYDAAAAHESTILVEKHALGGDWRLLVVGDRLIAASRREPAQVTGDGVSTIEQLVEQVNRDPRRSDGHATSLSILKLDEISLGVLTSQGLTPKSVPAAGQVVLIRRNANLSTGGTATDVTDLVHPEVALRAVQAARVVGLDISGVDVVVQDISRPLEEQGGVIVEVNAGPGLRMHLEPSTGQPRDVGEAIVDLLFPDGQNGRIPIVGVTGTNGKTTTTRLISHILRTRGWHVGKTCTDGIYLDGRQIAAGDCSGPQSAGMILQNPLVDAAVFETARGGILRAGLAFDRCDVAVITNIGSGDHLGMNDIDTPEQMAWVKRTVSDAVAPTGYGVFKADDPLTVEMAGHCPGQTIFFCRDAEHAVVQQQLLAGKRAVFVRDGQIIVAEGQREQVVTTLADVPLTHHGMITFQVENVLAAVGAAWGLNVSFEVVRQALRSYTSDMASNPGRFNLLEVNGATVIVDYAHNVSALEATLPIVAQFPHARRTIVYSAAGDRRDIDMIEQGKLLGDCFDRVILYEDEYIRGRQPGEISGLFRQGVQRGSRGASCEEVHGGISAVETALQNVQPGDLVVIQPDCIDKTVDFMRQYLASRCKGQEIDLNTVLRGPASVAAYVGEKLD